MTTAERFWTRRLRWRLLGAWRWPAYAVATVVDAVLLHEVGTGVRFNWPVSLILASFVNVALLAAADVLARLTARNRAARGTPMADTQLEITIDRGGVALLVVGMLGLAASGIATHHLIVSETRATEANARAVERYVNVRGTDEYRRNIETANTVRLAPDYFRTCIADDARRRFLCLFVDTKRKPPTVVRDPSTLPNKREAGGPG
ncbi:MAG: hypothetical protein QOH38_495 [Thermoleophilaceae bacterium]|nr:hypothetical protein [Thermoleophilaceae bacterium]